MNQVEERYDRAHQPLLKVITFGEFSLEQLLPSPLPGATQPQRMHLHWEEGNSRSTALTILKILLCRSGRRATKEELISAIWEVDHDAARTTHIFDTAVSLLRRRILRASDGESLLTTIRGGEKTSFRLPTQDYLWIDADAFLELASKATLAEQHGDDPLLYLEAAHNLAQGGEFLDEDLDARWSQGKRLIINGARRRVLYKLVEIYSHRRHVDRAEELLFTFLVDNPTDEDALCQLMLLLAQKERRHEALNIYEYVANILRDEKREPAGYTRSLVHQIQQGLSLRESRAAYYSAIDAENLLSLPLEVQVEKGPLYRLLQRLQRLCRLQSLTQLRIAFTTHTGVATTYHFLVAWSLPEPLALIQ